MNDLLTWTSGVFHGSGTVNANRGATLNGGLKQIHSTRVVNLGGTSTWSAGNISLLDSSALVNTTGGVLTTNFDGSLINNNSGTFT